MADVGEAVRGLKLYRDAGGDAAARRLATAREPDPRARRPWPERDVALVATFLVTGIGWARPWPSPPSPSTAPREPGD